MQKSICNFAIESDKNSSFQRRSRIAYENTFLYYFVDTENSETETVEGYQRSEDSTPDSCSDEDDSISTSDSDESNDSDEQNVFKNGLPLFQDSSLPVSEFNAILLALRQRHNIANIALDSILKLLELCLPKGSQLPKSGYLFEKETEKELEYTHVPSTSHARVAKRF